MLFQVPQKEVKNNITFIFSSGPGSGRSGLNTYPELLRNNF